MIASKRRILRHYETFRGRFWQGKLHQATEEEFDGSVVASVEISYESVQQKQKRRYQISEEKNTNCDYNWGDELKFAGWAFFNFLDNF